MAMAAGENSKRLGRLLVKRRVEIGYRHRNVFAEAAGFTNDRVLADLENARRTNFSPATKAQVELALGWKPGSIDAVLDGRDPEVSDTAPVSEGGAALQDPEVPIGEFSDEHLLAIVSERLSGYKRQIAVLEARLEALGWRAPDAPADGELDRDPGNGAPTSYDDEAGER